MKNRFQDSVDVMIAETRKQEKTVTKAQNASTISEHTSQMGDVITGGGDVISDATKNRIVRLT